MVELKGIQKYFPGNGVYAVENADFTLIPGEIHALLGENGAGKSTLLRIMAGYLRATAGSIVVDGKEAVFADPASALRQGIGMVQQHPKLIHGLKTWEDCILGAEPRLGPFMRRKEARTRIAGLAGQWGLDIPLDSATQTLSVSQRQQAGILALLLRKARYLIFDEATAVLGPRETTALLRLLRQLCAGGCGIALISHKLEETLDIATRITLIRRGRTLATRAASSVAAEELNALMFGTEEAPASTPVQEASVRGASSLRLNTPLFPSRAQNILDVSKLSVYSPALPFIRNICFCVGAGEIVGIVGVRESGLLTLELALTGSLSVKEGSVKLKGRELAGRGIRAFRESGGAYLGAERTKVMAGTLSVRDNCIIHAHRRAVHGFWGKFSFMDRNYLDAFTAGVLNRAQITQLSSTIPASRMDSFSGGMQQRLLLAREFAEAAALTVLSEPLWGLDRQSRKKLLSQSTELAAKGNGALIFSTDAQELISLSHRIIVLRNGEVSADIPLEAKSGHTLTQEIHHAMV
ncbi:ATP-binding cassette domain-containing protein [Breznakiellaceae bacterium SP9]